MSYQPPPPPQGGGPSQPGPARQGHTAELVIGGVLGAVLVVVSGLLGLMLTTTTENGAIFFVGPVLGLTLPLVLVSRPVTRWWGVGLLIGFFLGLIVLGGACVALIASFSG